MKKLIVLAFAAIASMSIAGTALATNQAVPTQPTLDTHVRFGAISVDLTNARVVEITAGNQKITDASGVVHTGYFYSQSVLANHPAFKRYIRASTYSSFFYNSSMFTTPTCVNIGGVNNTRLTWINGGTTDIPDGCTVQQQTLQYSRTN